MKRISFLLPEPMWIGLNALVEKTGLSFSEHLRRAIDLYLKQAGKPTP